MRYCTRTNLHADRCGSAWLIKRFIDCEAEFTFVDGHTPLPETVPFDMHGVEWGHHGNKCTFETIVELNGITDPIVKQLAAIIHGADIASDSDETLESPGVQLMFNGMRLISKDDAEALERGYMLMDALYEGLKRGV